MHEVAPAPSAPPYYHPPAPQPKKVPEPSTTAALGLFALGVFGLKKKNEKIFPKIKPHS
ncbi:PEP-CTERM sorting domain-containing protein [Nostoc sp.]|uniref:PEP-CTERM sorting domain-containing protein n=1 Tax=Nostoc sp. TaxID=1180 RepID=UPI0025D7925E|nr:PEP-CTERM sorting domain-containing protein [Nostoc sp. NMS9]